MLSTILGEMVRRLSETLFTKATLVGSEVGGGSLAALGARQACHVQTCRGATWHAPACAYAQVHPAFRLIVCGETPESLGKARSCVSMLQCSSPRAQEVGGPISRLDRRGGCGSDVFRQSDLSRPGRSGPFSIFTVSRHCPATSSPLAYWRPCPLSPARPQWGLDSYMGKRRHQRDHVQLVRRSLAVLCAGPAAEAKDPCAAAGACCSVPRRSGASF